MAVSVERPAARAPVRVRHEGRACVCDGVWVRGMGLETGVAARVSLRLVCECAGVASGRA